MFMKLINIYKFNYLLPLILLSYLSVCPSPSTFSLASISTCLPIFHSTPPSSLSSYSHLSVFYTKFRLKLSSILIWTLSFMNFWTSMLLHMNVCYLYIFVYVWEFLFLSVLNWNFFLSTCCAFIVILVMEQNHC